MPLADEFQEIVDALPSDWTDMELDLRVQEDRYIDAATTSPRSTASRTPTTTGTGASSSPTSSATPPRRRPVHGTLGCSTRPGIRGELKLRDYRTGRVETTQMWGRPESVRQEFRRLRSQ